MCSTKRQSLLADAAERGIRYLDSLKTRPVFPEPAQIARLEKALDTPLPDGPADADEVLAFVDELGSPATVASAGGRYFGFVTGGALPASLAANWLAAAWDQNSFGPVSSPGVALFEEAALRWIRDCLDLPREAEGALVTGATMANFTCLAAARHAVLSRVGWDVEDRGLFGAPEITLVAGEEAHASVDKVIAMLGLGRGRVRRIPADRQGRMRAEHLPDIDGPAIVCIQAGNVSSGAFDPAGAVIDWARQRDAWVHVDGAFGLWARASSELEPLAAGLEGADSWAADAHKWLNVPYDCGIAFVRSPEALRAAMSTTGAYLLLGERRSAIDVTPEASRRARAVDVWAALKSLGRSGLDEMIARNCRQARWLAERLGEEGIEVMNDVVLNQIVVSFGGDERTGKTIAALQRSGECWCGGTRWHGREAMRISVSSWATTEADLERTLKAIVAVWRAS
jgi:glutamate/tyrosine decarboxylase-like PLP-dependent enzyme